MLKILGHAVRACDVVHRRQLLQACGAEILGTSLQNVLAAEALAAPVSARARSVVFLYGGPSQLETFDIKPVAPTGIREPFRPITSRTPGLQICEHLPRLAERSGCVDAELPPSAAASV